MSQQSSADQDSNHDLLPRTRHSPEIQLASTTAGESAERSGDPHKADVPQPEDHDESFETMPIGRYIREAEGAFPATASGWETPILMRGIPLKPSLHRYIAKSLCLDRELGVVCLDDDALLAEYVADKLYNMVFFWTDGEQRVQLDRARVEGLSAMEAYIKGRHDLDGLMVGERWEAQQDALTAEFDVLVQQPTLLALRERLESLKEQKRKQREREISLADEMSKLYALKEPNNEADVSQKVTRRKKVRLRLRI